MAALEIGVPRAQLRSAMTGLVRAYVLAWTVAMDLAKLAYYRIVEEHLGPATIVEAQGRTTLGVGRIACLIPGVESPDSLKRGFPTRARVRFPPAR